LTEALIFMLRKIVILAGLIISISVCAPSQSSPITFSIRPSAARKPLNAGDKFTVQIFARIKEGWHLYSLNQQPGGPVATRVMLPAGQPFKLAGAVQAPPPLVDFDPNFGIETKFYEDSAVFTLPIIVIAADSLTPGKKSLEVNVFFQTCNDRFCLPAKTVKLISTVEVAKNGPEIKPLNRLLEEKVLSKQASDSGQEGLPPDSKLEQASQSKSSLSTSDGEKPGATPVSQPPAGPPLKELPEKSIGAQTKSPVGTSSSHGLLSFIWLAMSLGALSLLTPCVFPMVPITVSYFTSHAEQSRANAVRNALVYSAGIILTFTALGFLLALFVGAAGINRFAANPWINLLIATIFLGFAVSLFGGYQVQIPSRVLTRLDAVTRRGGGGKTVSLLLMGLTFTLTSFTCTAPFVGTLLVMASQGQWQWPLLGMLAFSTVFSLPFFILALAPQLMTHLPRSGGWLNSVKVVMGFLEVAAAMKFLSNVDLVWRWNIFTREVVLAIWVAVALLMAFYLLGKFKLMHDSVVEHVGAVRLTLALICLALSFYLLTGLFGRRLGEIEAFLPPPAEVSAKATDADERRSNSGELEWIINDYQGALEKAEREKKLVLIDFTGYTCTNCRWMEANMFTREEVKRELEKYIRVRLYTDGEGDIYEQQLAMQQNKFGTVALPYYAVVDSTGKVLAEFPGLTRNEAEFLSFLKSGQTRLTHNTLYSKAVFGHL
jgi:thiol:disulfide interchange protein